MVLAELQVADEDLVVDLRPVGSRAKEVDTVQVGDVDTPTKYTLETWLATRIQMYIVYMHVKINTSVTEISSYAQVQYQ